MKWPFRRGPEGGSHPDYDRVEREIDAETRTGPELIAASEYCHAQFTNIRSEVLSLIQNVRAAGKPVPTKWTGLAEVCKNFIESIEQYNSGQTPRRAYISVLRNWESAVNTYHSMLYVDIHQEYDSIMD